MSDTYYETADTAAPDANDSWNHYAQDDLPEFGNDRNDTGPETSYYDQDYAPEDSDYYAQDYGREESLDETRARIAVQDGAEQQPDAARGSQSEITAADDKATPAEASDLTATQGSSEPADASPADPESRTASPPDNTSLPDGTGQGGDLEADDLQRRQDAAPASIDTRLEQDEAPGVPAGHDNRVVENGQPDVAGVLGEPARPDHSADEQARSGSPDLPGQDTAHNADEPHRPQDAGPSPPGSPQSAGDTGTSAADNAAPRSPDASPETGDRIKALLVQLDQTRAELDETRAERDHAAAERDQAHAELGQTKAELDQANQEIADLKAASQEPSAQIENPGQRPDTSDATDASRPERGAERLSVDRGRDSVDATEPEQAEDADRSRAQDAAGKEHKVPDHEDDINDASQHDKVRLRHVASPDNIAIGAALIDAQDVVQKVAAHAMHDAMTPAVAVLTGLAGVAVSKIQEQRKAKRK